LNGGLRCRSEGYRLLRRAGGEGENLLASDAENACSMHHAARRASQSDKFRKSAY
jgi:hypothetical protein